jgi:hypothetical protein
MLVPNLEFVVRPEARSHNSHHIAVSFPRRFLVVLGSKSATIVSSLGRDAGRRGGPTVGELIFDVLDQRALDPDFVRWSVITARFVTAHARLVQNDDV